MFGVLAMIGLSDEPPKNSGQKIEREDSTEQVRVGLNKALRDHAAMSERAIRIGSQVIDREDERRPVSDRPVGVPRRLRVLVVEDDAIVASAFARRIRQEGVDVDVALSLSEARASITVGNRYDIFVVDLLMGHENGADLVREIRRTDRLTPIIVVTGLELDEAERRLAGAENVEVHQKGRPLSLAPWLRDG